MAYVPVHFDLHDFQLNLNTAQSAKFHKRMKELGFDSVQNGDTLVYGRGKCRITAFVVNGAALNFLPDFYDDTPGGTVYAIMEKMCMAFGGTMVGKYTIDGVNNQWDVRISKGMNLSGKADVGKRDHVVDENAAGHLAPSARPQSNGGQTAQAIQQSAPASHQGGGQVQAGQQGESTRDKLYRVLVEEAYQKHITDKGAYDPEFLVKLIKAFNQQFPKEEETEEQKKRAQIIQAFKDYFNNPGADEKWLNREIQLLIDNDEEIAMNVADQFGLDEGEIEDVIEDLNGGIPFGAKATPQ